MKIFVLTYSDAKIDDYLNKARSLGFNVNDITFCLPEHFKISLIKDSIYSDFIYGSSPHHMKGVSNGAIIHQIRTNQKHYPKLFTCVDNKTYLKLSISQFAKFLLQTNYYKANKKQIEINKIKYQKKLKEETTLKNKNTIKYVPKKSSSTKKIRYGNYLAQFKGK